MLGSPAGAGGAQRGNLWPIAPASASSASFASDGFSKYGIYSLFPGTANFANTLYSHNAIGRFSSGTIQSAPTAFHATHKDSIFSGYTLGAPTPPPGSPYSPVPVSQLELLAKGFGPNIIIQGPQQPQQPQQQQQQQPPSPKKAVAEKRPEDAATPPSSRCCASQRHHQQQQQQHRPCGCSKAEQNGGSRGGGGCSRTEPVSWAPVQVKKEPGATPCQVAEVSTSVVKVEAESPTVSKEMPSIVTANGNIPVGIAVARQRVQQEVISSPSLPPQGLLTTVNTSTHQIKEMTRLTEIAEATAGMAAGAGGALLQCADERGAGLAAWPAGGAHTPLAAAPTLWQYPAPLPMEPIVPMSVPMPPVGFQLVRDPTTGGLLLLPTSAEPLQQAVVWPSYATTTTAAQPSSHVLLPQLPPPPLQLLSSSSDFMQTSTTLHQHTQTHSTRLLAVTTDHGKRKIPLPIPATTLIKIETDATTVDHTKTHQLQAVSTVATNNAVFGDHHQPVLAAHLIYQHHPTNLILSQPATQETQASSCRSQATSPVTCLTPPPENHHHHQHEVEETFVQDASNQTDTPICSEEELEEGRKQEGKLEEVSTTSLVSEVTLGICEVNEDRGVVDTTTRIVEVEKELKIIEIEEVQEESKGEVIGEGGVRIAQEVFSGQPEIIENNPEPDTSVPEKLEPPQPELVVEPLPPPPPPPPSPPKEMVISEQPDMSGLELLSSIIDIENRRVNVTPVSPSVSANKDCDKFGGLNLLCALAEQRFLEEVTKQKRKQKAIERSERKKEKRKNRNRDSDEPKHKKSKYYINEFGEKVKIKDQKTNAEDEKNENSNLNINLNNNKSCNCHEDFRSYKSEEKAKKFIASKTQTLFEKGDFPCMNANELSMRMKLADLQRKYREKQQELVKLKSKKHSNHHKDQKECSKKHHRSRKKSSFSDRETPPPVLDKIDQIKIKNRNGDLLKPPRLCAITDNEHNVDINENNKRCFTPDLNDSSPEKASSKKRKVGRPKKLLPSSNSHTTTETLVAKKTKKCYAIGYLLAAKQRLIENNVFSDTPPRFIEESNENEKENELIDSKKSKIRPKLKAEPTIKNYHEDEDLDDHHHEDHNSSWVDDERKDEEAEDEEIRLKEEEKEELEEEIKEVLEGGKEEVEKSLTIGEPEEPVDDRCLLKPEDLDKESVRVLTAMGGLFYAGELKAIEPPDVYSITLDGERGNRPHIMPREEILRDAILEVRPTSEEELTVGTRVVAYWSQKYRCLYPGSVAEPDTPNSKFISVDFDDGDNGKISLKDIRLLPPDYPFMEYDPNPLSSLSKRKRRVSTTSNERKNSINSTDDTRPQETPSSSHKDKKKTKKKKRDKLRRESEGADKKRKKKHKCAEENCQHRCKKHKKHKKHRKHHHNKEEKKGEVGVAPGDDPLEAEKPKGGEDNRVWEEDSENLCDPEVEPEREQEEEEEDVIGNPDDEVTMEDIEEALDERQRGIRNRQASCESRSKMSAFLPDSNLWNWLGEGRTYKFRGKKKIHYKSIQRGKEVITLGDAAVFLSTGSPDRPYIGIIEKLWEICGNMKSRVRWYYHPEEATGYDIKFEIPGALLESNHQDENDVQTICRKCDVIKLDQFKQRLNHDKELYAKVYENQDLYYLAGYYDPSLVQLTVAEGTPILKCVALKETKSNNNNSK